MMKDILNKLKETNKLYQIKEELFEMIGTVDEKIYDCNTESVERNLYDAICAIDKVIDCVI